MHLSSKLIRPLILLAAITVGACATPEHPDHDDLMRIAVENASPAEEEAFKEYFRIFINDVVDDEYIGPPIATRSAKFTLKIVVDEKLHQGGAGAKPSAEGGLHYGYRIHLDLIRNRDKVKVWTYVPDRWMTYPNYKQSIKWLAKYSAKRLKKSRLLNEEHLQ